MQSSDDDDDVEIITIEGDIQARRDKFADHNEYKYKVYGTIESIICM